ncbi:hypothetical protein BST63_35550 [Bradyrhizobium canariense]|uniref:Uncharacterized protein n=1 Tax=Bradyrhizobium canariense TaxID=255045 RepID=A0ABX3WSI4_9BRAD|nr:hypothetical protein BSR47_31850 [Bradyrhizobium canariense]OSJ21047.1 hypothetical protein BST63_35550 [Bradyrhizobium canariense]
MLSREIIYQQIWVTRDCAFDALSDFERRGSGFHQPQVPRMFNHPCEVIGEDIQPISAATFKALRQEIGSHPYSL